MTDESCALSMAAAIAAAIELEENGGMSLCDIAPKITEERETPAFVSSSPELDGSSDAGDDDLGDDFEEGGGTEKRLARSRERNREHARRTRLRKKAQLETLQSKHKGLEAEGRLLKQSIEECSIASILLGISSGKDKMSVTDSLLDVSNLDKDIATPKVSIVVGGKRKRFVSEDAMEKAPRPLKFTVDGQTTIVGGGKTHINWKSGIYCDEGGVQKQLTQKQLEGLRRERNRMHAKMTRDRKKCFISAIKKTIDDLTSDNKKMRQTLAEVAKHHFGPNAITPHSSPLFTAIANNDHQTPDIQDTMGSPAIDSISG